MTNNVMLVKRKKEKSIFKSKVSLFRNAYKTILEKNMPKY